MASLPLPKVHSSSRPTLEELAGRFAVTFSFSSQFVPKTSHVIAFPSAEGQQSAELTAALLAANHAKYHCFFNEKQFHNHIVHHLLALYSLGASPDIIEESFYREAREQRPILRTKHETIDHTNWSLHLGQEEYYENYLKFFGGEIERKSAIEVVEEYIFASHTGDLLSRSFSGLLHPIIHWGYGLEFKIDAIVAEGLAITAVHGLTMEGLKITDLVKSQSSSGLFEKLLSKNDSPAESAWIDWGGQSSTEKYRPKSGLTAFEIMAKIAEDLTLVPPTSKPDLHENTFAAASSSKELAKWFNYWEVESNCGWNEIVERTKEIIWAVTVLYMASFDSEKGTFNLSFASMHLVTSSIFLPVILPLIKPSFRPTLLKSFFRVTMAVWIAVGRPDLRISECVNDKRTLKLPESQGPIKGENPWFKVISSAARHPDEHTTKIIRTFAFAAKFYGNTKKGYYSCGLKGSELLDSSIFLRAAIMTLNKQDWERDGDSRVFKWFS